MASDRAQPLVTSPDNLSWVPRIHMVGENQGLHILLWPLPQACGTHKIDTQQQQQYPSFFFFFLIHGSMVLTQATTDISAIEVTVIFQVSALRIYCLTL